MSDLLTNAFYVLGASPRTSKGQLAELAEDAALTGDHSEVADARSALSNPRSRLKAEVSWLLGVSPSRAKTLISKLRADPREIYGDLGVPPLAAANLIASALHQMQECTDADVHIACEELADHFASLDASSIRRDLNEDRQVAGFPQIADDSPIEAEIESLRRHYIVQMLAALDRLPTHELISTVTELTETATDNGESQAPALIGDLVEAYEARAGTFLEDESASILELIAETKEAADSGADPTAIDKLTGRILERIKHWDSIAQPIQLIKQSKGLPHDGSINLATTMRSLAVHLFNKHDYLNIAKKISATLREAFAEVPDIVDQVDEDIDALEEIFEQRQQSQRKEAEEKGALAEEITYETAIGFIFKDHFKISPAGVEWKGIVAPLESVSSVSWGGVKSQYSTTYSVFLHSDRGLLNVELTDQSKFGEIIDRVWRAIGVRLLVEHMNELRRGGRLRFGDIVMSDAGITLPVPKLFRANESEFVSWSQARRSKQNGSVSLTSESGKARGSFDLRTTPNAPVISTAIDIFWKKGGDRLSSILGK
ncbi:MULTISPECIES: hypothetical protein [unclassified Luteimonas]|uniref:hypothetical protein n=1 Tax=unclassified Luteimonas TaxID=2629088 RepID=UPI0016047ED7|nr:MULTISPECIES: hypothetical protein [unclassified Luteimonas]MBB1473230.1 hypothetical protein [Luteimonas sp. MC1782]MBB6598066.1 hypothetical protein [Luteimonas sp. MC1825]QOC88302.1 hypothetical protein IDM46_00530 [Luteimonas sp. MC1825]